MQGFKLKKQLGSNIFAICPRYLFTLLAKPVFVNNKLALTLLGAVSSKLQVGSGMVALPTHYLAPSRHLHGMEESVGELAPRPVEVGDLAGASVVGHI
jgi:hypothetical protein